jgi:hypothetical protein
MKLEHIVFIYGMPRSRTSLVSGIFARCGAFFGKVRKSIHNPKGIYENEALRFSCFNELFSSKWSLQKSNPINGKYTNTELPNLMSSILEYQGYKNGCAAYKYAYYHLCDDWIKHFNLNKITLIGTKRNIDQTIQSCRVCFKQYRKLSRENFTNLYQNCLNKAEQLCIQYPNNAYILDTDKIFNGDFSEIKPIIDDNPFLQWDENSVSSWVDIKYNEKHRNSINFSSKIPKAYGK